MIQFLLTLFGIALGAIIVYVIGRLLVDTVKMFQTRARRDDSAVLWRDGGAIAIALQFIALAGIIALVTFLWSNFRTRTDEIGLDLNFDFLSQPGGISIFDNPLEPSDSVGAAITAGFMNTIRVIVVGIPLSLLLGTIVGVSRFSSNFLVRKLATGYVEFIRNIPPLLVIIFFWTAVFLERFPRSQEAWRPLDGWFIFSNNRFAFPSLMRANENFEAFRIVILVAIVAAVVVGIWRTKVFNNTGAPHRRTLWGLGTFATIVVVAFFILGGPMGTSKPFVDEEFGRVWEGGLVMQMPYVALTLALIVYTATHISEIVRGSILAVHKGQGEAADALALSTIQRYRFVILPQAFRVAFPPLISQFLNYSKNSSLALAIGFAELTGVTVNLFGQSRPAPQLLLILALLYLTLSLILSLVGNVINRRLQLVGR